MAYFLIIVIIVSGIIFEITGCRNIRASQLIISIGCFMNDWYRKKVTILMIITVTLSISIYPRSINSVPSIKIKRGLYVYLCLSYCCLW
ncbi:hypothetical protein BDF14DRAFT_1940758 [Spinellus fusiger]|nr:hypothetical protein BDF14DRAFT_1940756 [Spinellus fusiger]KAI7871053.1 hypothetical protein BDF14DRAFT_1940758 [Spinellus fusiger]